MNNLIVGGQELNCLGIDSISLNSRGKSVISCTGKEFQEYNCIEIREKFIIEIPMAGYDTDSIKISWQDEVLKICLLPDPNGYSQHTNEENYIVKNVSFKPKEFNISFHKQINPFSFNSFVKKMVLYVEVDKEDKGMLIETKVEIED